LKVFLVDMTRFGDMNEAYGAFFSGDPPSRITVGCNALALGAAIEIEAVAYLPAGR
jgi:2-iminobutanoate/2-iminopropanoate deaminase